MLSVPAEFPHVGSTAWFDDRDAEGRDVTERVRIMRHNGDGTCLVSIRSRRYPHELASGCRTLPLADLRATEQPAPQKPTAPARKRKAA